MTKKELQLQRPSQTAYSRDDLSCFQESCSQINSVWAKEADARVEAYEHGEVDTIPAEEVFAKYNQEVD